ncbi:MAG: TonB-dependent receptor [Nannocystaceae bacterium]
MPPHRWRSLVGGLFAIAAIVTCSTSAQAMPVRPYLGPEAVPQTIPGATPARTIPEAQPPAPERVEAPTEETRERDDGFERDVVVETPRPTPSERDRASTIVTRQEIQERIPRSAPDAVRYEPGVYVQQTAHGQGSPYIRGLTGQQTIMLIDGVRLNNSTFRQGPNQYFFTLDAQTIESIEVLRGSASTRYGSDALSGALITQVIRPTLVAGERAWEVHPKAMLKTATADTELGGRGQVDIAYKGKLGLFGGLGYRDVGKLRTGGPIYSPTTGDPVRSPVFDTDGVTQLGTGFREFTADAHTAWAINDKLQLRVAYYDYRQFDAPRTDKCPPPTAPITDCLVYDEQFRTLVYTGLDGVDGPPLAERVTWRLSFQRQHERRSHGDGEVPDFENIGRDDVYTFGTTLKISSKRFAFTPDVGLRLHYGADGYFDTIESRAWIAFYDTKEPITVELTRGQYLDGAQYFTSGAFGEVELDLLDRLTIRAGGRGALVLARADGDLDSESQPIDRDWTAAVGNVGVTLKTLDWLRIAARVDGGFRAPNLDDLTSRQQVGPGYQRENADLEPERSRTVEAGFLIDHPWIQANVFAFHMRLDQLIARAPGTCPSGTDDGCGGAQTVLQLVNLEGPAQIRGVDGLMLLKLPRGFTVQTAASYAWGDGPNPVPGGTPERVALSRIPPLNGYTLARWGDYGFYVGAGVHWALAQLRLSIGDAADVRIPIGGTPGYVYGNVFAGYRWDPFVLVSLMLENVSDAPFRNHGSSVNGPGRGLRVFVQFGF